MDGAERSGSRRALGGRGSLAEATSLLLSLALAGAVLTGRVETMSRGEPSRATAETAGLPRLPPELRPTGGAGAEAEAVAGQFQAAHLRLGSLVQHEALALGVDAIDQAALVGAGVDRALRPDGNAQDVVLRVW